VPLFDALFRTDLVYLSCRGGSACDAFGELNDQPVASRSEEYGLAHGAPAIQAPHGASLYRDPAVLVNDGGVGSLSIPTFIRDYVAQSSSPLSRYA
jgi:hypothetical protein